MELESLLKLIDAVSNSTLTKMEYKDESIALTLRKEEKTVVSNVVPMPAAAMAAPFSAAPAEAPTVQTTAVQERVTEGNVIKAPLVGTFYASSSPENPPFVKVGDTVSKGQTLGIIEAMKLMNEIESDYDGVIKEILIENEKMVEYGQPLFVIG